jgi:hypothetical protein
MDAKQPPVGNAGGCFVFRRFFSPARGLPMLELWGYDNFNFADSGTWLRVVILLALMICAVWVTFRTEK